MNQISFSANYRSRPLDGIFSKMRAIGIFLKENVSIYSPESHISDDFCGKHLQNGDIYYIIDGDSNTAWRNKVSCDVNIILDFKNSNILIKSYTFEWPCNRNDNWTVKGSNDNETWYDIDKVENDTENVIFSHKKCKKQGTYRFIKFVTDGYFHLANIELFGIFNPRYFEKTCKINYRRSSFSLSLMVILLLCHQQ